MTVGKDKVNLGLQSPFLVNYAAFILVIWLGLYLVTRNPKYPISWLTGLTLWSLATFFLHYMLDPMFWSSGNLQISVNRWFEGIAVAPALAFWHHTTMLMRPRQLNSWRWVRILMAYVIAVAAVILQATTDLIWSRGHGCDLTDLSCRHPGPLYPVFIAAMVVFIAASMINLFRSARTIPAELPRKQLRLLAWATLVAGLVAPAISLAAFAKWSIPTTVITLLLAITVVMMGYGVARYSALMEGRTIYRDFFYNLLMVALVGAIYVPVCWLLVQVYSAPAIIFILIPCLAIFTHSLVNPAYQLVDKVLLRRETRQTREDLRHLSRLAFEDDALAANLAQTLLSLCRTVSACYGLILTFEEGFVHLMAGYRWPDDVPLRLPQETFRSDDVTQVEQGQLPAPLEETALIIPLYRENEQFGAILLGHPLNGPRFAHEDVDRILNPAEMIGEAIHMNWLRRKLMAQVTQLGGRSSEEGRTALPVELVEGALRNLFDYAFLADSPLANMGLVQYRLARGAITHIDRGKAVHQVLVESLDKLNPGIVIARDPPPRECYPYTILKEAYLDGISNRDIMMHLYISEGTFNRTRRAALRSVARTLEEMENNLQ